MKLGGIYVSVGAKTDRLKADLAKAKTMTAKTSVLMQSGINKINFARIGLAMTAVAGSSIMVGKKVLDIGRSFESTMKTVQAWSGATGFELQGLTDIAREMGATTEWTATQSAEALKYLAAAGFTAKQSIAALPGALNLATAGQVDLASATDITTDVLTAFKLNVEDLNRVNDAFITTASNSNTNVMMLGQSMKMVAPTAKLFGLSVEQTAAFLGTLANSGVKAEMAGSGLNMVLLKSQRAAKTLGMALDSSLIDVLKRMKKEQWGAVQIGEAFGARQVKTAAILMDNIDAYEGLTKKIIENAGATTDLAAIIRDSLDVDIKTLSSTIQEQLLKTFNNYKDAVREVVQGMTEWIRANSDLIQQGLHTYLLNLVNIMRFFHNGWLGLKLVAHATVQAIATGLNILSAGFRDLLLPLDLLYTGLVKLGWMAANPFDQWEKGMSDFAVSSIIGTKSVLADIEKTNNAYDSAIAKLGEWKNKVPEISTAHAKAAGKIISSTKNTSNVIAAQKPPFKIDPVAIPQLDEVKDKAQEVANAIENMTPAFSIQAPTMPAAETTAQTTAGAGLNLATATLAQLQSEVYSWNAPNVMGVNVKWQEKVANAFLAKGVTPPPMRSFATGTGPGGLPNDGLFYGHKGEIVKNPKESKAERRGITGNTYNITIAPTFMTGDRAAARSVATEIRRELDQLAVRRA